MTTTFLAAMVELSKQIGDYWASTSTGEGSTTTLVDTALKAKANDWINRDTWIFLTEEPASTASIYDERKVSSLDNSTGTLTNLAFSEAPGTGIDYELHRLFTASEKKRALIYAARAGYPNIHEKVWDESIVSGNWLKDGSFEIWSSISALTYWTAVGPTIAQTTTSPYYKHGATSCKIDGGTGYVHQNIALWDDLKKLAGKTVKVTLQGNCDTASDLRIGVLYDGVNIEYSDYHDTDNWTEDKDPLSVAVTIDDNPSDIGFRIYHDAAAGTSYVDDFRVIGPDGARIYIGNLGLAQERPVRVSLEASNYATLEPWTLIHNAVVDTEDGYLYLPSSVPQDRRLRIIGMGYLDFLASGSSSTAWTATINLNSPQIDILVAQAALYLYTEMSMPNFTSGDRKDFMEMMGFWQQELRKRINKFGMPIPSIPVKWR